MFDNLKKITGTSFEHLLYVGLVVVFASGVCGKAPKAQICPKDYCP